MSPAEGPASFLVPKGMSATVPGFKVVEMLPLAWAPTISAGGQEIDIWAVGPAVMPRVIPEVTSVLQPIWKPAVMVPAETAVRPAPVMRPSPRRDRNPSRVQGDWLRGVTLRTFSSALMAVIVHPSAVVFDTCRSAKLLGAALPDPAPAATPITIAAAATAVTAHRRARACAPTSTINIAVSILCHREHGEWNTPPWHSLSKTLGCDRRNIAVLAVGAQRCAGTQ